MPTTRRALLAGAGGAVLAGVAAPALTGCSSGGGDQSSAGPGSAASTAPAATPSPTTAAPAAPPAPAGLAARPVLAVKIDHTPASVPRAGIGAADVVYVEPVEAGLTRYLAVFASHQPAAVGPVRSARESDVDLLANYGPVAFAFSGASAMTLGIIGHGAQKNVPGDGGGGGYQRSHSRSAPYNLIGNPTALLARAGGSTPPRDVGLHFGPAPAGGAPAGGVQARWRAARLDLRWDAGTHRYLVTSDGRPETDANDGSRVGAGTVIVQHVSSRLSANRDVNGQPTPVEQVIGSGAASVLRDGQVWNGTWTRPDAMSPTRFAAGPTELTMADGPVWILLLPNGISSASIG